MSGQSVYMWLHHNSIHDPIDDLWSSRDLYNSESILREYNYSTERNETNNISLFEYDKFHKTYLDMYVVIFLYWCKLLNPQPKREKVDPTSLFTKSCVS